MLAVNLGFRITAKMASGMTDLLTQDAFFDRLVECVEHYGLAFGGGCGDGINLDGFVTSVRDALGCESADQNVLTEFLRADPDVESFVVGPLEDADA